MPNTCSTNFKARVVVSMNTGAVGMPRCTSVRHFAPGAGHYCLTSKEVREIEFLIALFTGEVPASEENVSQFLSDGGVK